MNKTSPIENRIAELEEDLTRTAVEELAKRVNYEIYDVMERFLRDLDPILQGTFWRAKTSPGKRGQKRGKR